MKTLHVTGVPDELYNELQEDVRIYGRTFNQQLLLTLEAGLHGRPFLDLIGIHSPESEA